MCTAKLGSLLFAFFSFSFTGKTRDMPPKQRSIPPALELGPEVNLLTEFALIATSPQSPLVREVNGESVDARCSEGESPPPQLVDPKQMVCGTVSQHDISDWLTG